MKQLEILKVFFFKPLHYSEVVLNDDSKISIKVAIVKK